MPKQLTELRPPVQRPVSDTVDLIATHAGMDAGSMAARLELQNGNLLTTAVVRLDDQEDRAKFARDVLRKYPAWVGDQEFLLRAMAELSNVLVSTLGSNDGGTGDAVVGGHRDSQATKLVGLALETGAELWHTADDRCYATLVVNGHREHVAIRAQAFRRWIAQLFYTREQKAPGAQELQDALAVLEGKATFEGPEHKVAVRITEHEGAIYFDLANEVWQAVEIRPDGWSVVDEPPVRFVRVADMRPLPIPIVGGKLEDLRSLVHFPTDEDWRLFVSWIIAAMRPTGPFLILCLYGEQGAAKSTTERLAVSLIDPRKAPLLSPPRDVRDVAIAASTGWLQVYDNLSGLPDWLSDALCRLSTGSGLKTRALYTDDEQAIFQATRPIAINGIEEVATSADLLDRAITITLAPIPDDKRRDEQEFWASFEQARPRILGALCSIVSTALRNLPKTVVKHKPRMADFTLWSCAAAPACGWTAEEFLAAYRGTREQAYATSLDAAPWFDAIKAIALPWSGTATTLHKLLSDHVGEHAARQKGWPANGQVLAGKLRRSAPALRAIGIEVTFRQAGKAKTRIVALEQVGETASAPSAPSADEVAPDGEVEEAADAVADAVRPPSRESVRRSSHGFTW